MVGNCPVEVAGAGPVEIPDIPVGRPMTLRLEMDDGVRVVAGASAVTGTAGGERAETTLTVP